MGLLALLIQECLFFLGYVTGSQQYPKPLTRREEAKLLAEMAEGSEEARRELILHNLRLVAHIARKYTVPGHNAEDLTSIGVVGSSRRWAATVRAAGPPWVPMRPDVLKMKFS